MIKKTFDIALRIGREDIVIAPAVVVQNDYDVYSLSIRIFDGYEEIDYSQVSSATITFALANNSVVQSDPERLTLSSIGITYEMGTDEINYPGDVIGSVQLLGSSGERITTARFKFPVMRDLITPGAVQSDSNFPLLQKLLADVEQLKSDIVNLQVPNGSLLDEKLSDAAGQIKARVASHLEDYVRQAGYGTATGTNALVITLSPAPAAYVDGMAISFKNTTQNTGAVTINVNGLGAKNVLKSNGSALASGSLKANSVYTVRYNGASFMLQGEGGDLRVLPNLIKNGSYERGMLGWADYQGYDSVVSGVSRFGDKCLKGAAIPSGAYTYTYQGVNLKKGHKYYASVWVRIDSANLSSNIAYIRAGLDSTNVDVGQTVITTSGEWILIGGILEIPRTGNWGVTCIISVSSASFDAYRDGFSVIDLTEAFGPNNEPSSTEMRSMLSYSWNLIKNGNTENGTADWVNFYGNPTITVESGRFKMTSATDGWARHQPVRVKPNTNYYISGNVTSNCNLMIYEHGTSVVLFNGVGTFNTGNRSIIDVVISVYPAGIGYFDSIMVVEGTTAPAIYDQYRDCWWDNDIAKIVPIKSNQVDVNVMFPYEGYVNLIIDEGYYYPWNGTDGVFLRITDPEFVSSNLAADKEIFGLRGNLCPVPLGQSYAISARKSGGSVSPGETNKLLHTFNITMTGRFTFRAQASGNIFYIDVKRNGTTVWSTSFTNQTIKAGDINVRVGDVITVSGTVYSGDYSTGQFDWCEFTMGGLSMAN